MSSEHEEQHSRFARFLHSEVSGSVVLLLCAVAALIWANSPWAESYEHLSHKKIGVSFGEHEFSMGLSHWIADGLMAIFFFVVGLEIKREVLAGQLSSMRNAALPVAAAFGGMLVPAGVYAMLNLGGPGADGWGIPMATDIAFALGILAVFGSRAPLGLKVFLAALAIADDLGAVLVIAVFYTDAIAVGGLALAGVCLALIVGAGRLGIRQTWVYVLLAVVTWSGVMASGVHATVAGVLLAFCVPVRAVIDPREFIERTKSSLAVLSRGELTRESPLDVKEHREALDDIYLAVEDMRPAGLTLEHQLHPIQSFLILPLFALFMAGVKLDSETLTGSPAPITLGVILGLTLGKLVGVSLFSWLAVKSGKASLPEGVTWPHILGAASLAGVGFTMSIFVTELAFDDASAIGEAKIGVLIASAMAGILGYVILSRTLPRKS